MLGVHEALVHDEQATLYKINAELPALSRPLYECLMTGKPPLASGIVHNGITRLSTQPHLFKRAHAAGKVTAAAAYHWFSELYNPYPLCCGKRSLYR